MGPDFMQCKKSRGLSEKLTINNLTLVMRDVMKPCETFRGMNSVTELFSTMPYFFYIARIVSRYIVSIQ